MSDPLRRRLETLLEQVEELIPADAIEVRVEVPEWLGPDLRRGEPSSEREPTARRWVEYVPTADRDDLLLVGWMGRDGAVRHRYLHVPEGDVSEEEERTYHLARRAGASIEAALEAAVHLNHLPGPEQEIYLTLLEDRTPFERVDALTRSIARQPERECSRTAPGNAQATRSNPRLPREEETMSSREHDAARYAEKVVRILTPEFQLDEITRDIVRDVVRSHRLQPARQLEVILDDPISANWRLKAGRDDTSTVRVADYHHHDSAERTARTERINALLAAA